MITCAFLAVSIAAVDVRSHDLSISLDPAAHQVRVQSQLRMDGAGPLRVRLPMNAGQPTITLNDAAIAPPGVGADTITMQVTDAGSLLRIEYLLTAREDIAAGERPGEIHNKAVHAHVAPEGVFLSDGSGWHPVVLDDAHHPQLTMMSVEIQPLEGWTLVASGEPAAHRRDISEPVWNWRTPRPVDGMAIAGRPGLQTIARSHAVDGGQVEVAVLTSSENAAKAQLFLDAACTYLDLYVPLLGPFPYARFSIVENFFSSGFAYPGFTLLGPQVVAMGQRSLSPGYLDHELLHNWWGNGVYVDPAEGNWCEALTSYCANYGRRLLEDGEDAARDYRRGVLMKLSSDPKQFDNGPLGDFGRAGAASRPDRFVGYEKGTFFFIMLEQTFRTPDPTGDRAQWWRTLRTFGERHMGRRAGWSEFKAVVESAYRANRTEFFGTWLHGATLPITGTDAAHAVESLAAQIAPGQGVESHEGNDQSGPWIEVDPDFLIWRVLPLQQIIPTLAGTTGAGGMRVLVDEQRPEIDAYMNRIESNDNGENLLIIEREAARGQRALIERTSDPITIDESSFTLGGTTYDQSDQAVLHTMQHPDRPGRFITVFLANGEAGWSRLRLINFYTRDTTIIWRGEQVIDRRTHEPDRRLRPGG